MVVNVYPLVSTLLREELCISILGVLFLLFIAAADLVRI